MTEQQNGLRFDIYERVQLSEEMSGIKELESIELVPHIQVLAQDDQAVLRGNLLLNGVYVDEEERADQPLEHLIPVEITLPMNRVQRMEDISVEIDNFDVDFLGSRSLNITGVLSLNGLELISSPIRDDWQETEEEVIFVHQAEARTEKPAAAEEPKNAASDEASPASQDAGNEAGFIPVHLPLEQQLFAVEFGHIPHDAPGTEPVFQPAQPGQTAPAASRNKAAAEAFVKEAPSAPAAKENLAGQKAEEPAQPTVQERLEETPEAAEASAPPQQEAPEAMEASAPPQQESEEEAEAVPASAQAAVEPETVAVPEPEKKGMKIGFGSKQNVPAEVEAESKKEAPAASKGFGIKSMLKFGENKPGKREEEIEPPIAEEKAPATERTDWKKRVLGSAGDRQEFKRMRLCIVQKEETLEQIAKRYELNPREIALFNRLGDNEVSEGQIVYIPK